jgi:hypothetical protein
MNARRKIGHAIGAELTLGERISVLVRCVLRRSPTDPLLWDSRSFKIFGPFQTVARSEFRGVVPVMTTIENGSTPGYGLLVLDCPEIRGIR